MFYKEVFVGTLWRGKTKKMGMVLCRAPFGADNKGSHQKKNCDETGRLSDWVVPPPP